MLAMSDLCIRMYYAILRDFEAKHTFHETAFG